MEDKTVRDDGPVNVSVGVCPKGVVVQFERSVTWLLMSPEDARDLASLIIGKSYQIPPAEKLPTLTPVTQDRELGFHLGNKE